MSAASDARLAAETRRGPRRTLQQRLDMDTLAIGLQRVAIAHDADGEPDVPVPVPDRRRHRNVAIAVVQAKRRVFLAAQLASNLLLQGDGIDRGVPGFL